MAIPFLGHTAPATVRQSTRKMSGQPVYDEPSILDLARSSKLCAQCRAIFRARPQREFISDPFAARCKPHHGERSLVIAVFDVGCVLCRHLFNSAPAHDEFLARVRAEWNDVGPDNLASLFCVGSGFYDNSCGLEIRKDKRFFTLSLRDSLKTPGNRAYWHIESLFTITTCELLCCRGHSHALPPSSQLIASL